jgi:CheY-like chemotaxis protein
MTRRYGGAGLGLAISARLVAMMNGSLWVESDIGRGSTFHFNAKFRTLSEVASEARPAEHRLQKVEQPLRVLLAEDNEVNQQLTLEFLRKRGHEVQLARNGIEVLAALETDRFDIVLMDVQMPEMDGFQATSAIRAREERTGEHLPIVAITGHAMKGDRQRCLDAGMDAYICKPIHSKELFDCVESITRTAVRSS